MVEHKPFKLAPSILTADFGHLAAEMRAAEAGGADYLHVDIMEPRFAGNLSFGPVVVESIRKATTLPLDLHLMVEEPERYVATFAALGADIITVHVEASHHLHRTIHQIAGLGRKAGVALNPTTPVEAAREILPFVDLVLIMTVDPGIGGQHFIETMTSKVRRMRKLMDELCPLAELEVEGGVDPANIADIYLAGARVFVAGSAVFNARASVAANLAQLRESVNGAL